MTQQPLKDSVKQHYAQQRLDDEQLAVLEGMFETKKIAVAPVSKGNQGGVKALFGIGALAASLVLVVAMLLLTYLPEKQSARVVAIATEVAEEHLKQNPLEVSSHDFTVVQNYFQKLDFLPSAPGYLGDTQHVLGGRYCSIQTVPAAQIRYKSGQKTTLYQVAYDVQQFGEMPDVGKGEQPITQTVKGVSVKIWVEQGIMMVSAESE